MSQAALDAEAPVLADLERRVEALESDDEAPVLAAGHSPVEPALEEADPFGRLRRRGAGIDEPTSPDDPEPATGPKQFFAAGEQPTGAKRLGATEPAPPTTGPLYADDEDATTPIYDADAALDARFAKREATVRASFLETTGSLAAYEHGGPDEGPARTERQRTRARKRRLKRNRRTAGIAAAEALVRAPLPAAEAPAPAYAEAPAPAATTPPASPERPPVDPAFTPTRDRWYKRRVAGVPPSPDPPKTRSLWQSAMKSFSNNKNK